MHLTAAVLVDLLDGNIAESSVPHLAACHVCRGQLDALRAVASDVADVEVPEPSPLFWDHLSARVRAAVAAETASTSWWHGGWWRLVTVATVAVAAMTFVVDFQLGSRRSSAPLAGNQAAVAAPPLDDAGDDESLRFVSDLAADVDLDAVLDSGLVARGSAERALAQMDRRERVALRRLLSEALTNGGA